MITVAIMQNKKVQILLAVAGCGLVAVYINNIAMQTRQTFTQSSGDVSNLNNKAP